MITEPAIDASLDHYVEERALAIALERAATQEERARVERLMDHRAALMQHREAFAREATARRHERGETYSAVRVASINAMAPTRDELEESVRCLYALQPDTLAVLQAHARTHFPHALALQRVMLAAMPPDVRDAARSLREHEERFAKTWLATIGDPAFDAEIRTKQREVLTLHRQATRPVFLVTTPACEAFGDDDARALGSAWTRLDQLSASLGHPPLSDFIAFDNEGPEADVPAEQLLPVVDALLCAIADRGRKFPSKRTTLSVLTRVREALARGGRAHFEVDL